MKKYLSISLLILFSLITIGAFIYIVQIRTELRIKEIAVRKTLYSWKAYIDSVSKETKAYQDTIKNLRLELERKNIQKK